MHPPLGRSHTTGVIERRFESLKCERLYRHDIATGIDLAAQVADFIDEYDTIRPHEALHWRRPIDAHLQDPTVEPRPLETDQEG